ncbi:MAG: glutamate--tRNA ligase [Clostridiales bacterium]|nr:glutamate--tRNA ligase [Clostridiales bacterium]
MKKVRVRFAPSPTGPLHIGGARSALFNYLFARKEGGDFILRMEDTDRERSSAASEEDIKRSLLWLGIEWNEGVDVGGPCAPYRQTERLRTYDEAARRLIEAGHAYYCYCSPEELESAREALQAQGQTPRYNGACLSLDDEGRRAKEAEGRRPVIRFRVPDEAEAAFDDLVRGKVVFSGAEIGGDFVIVKSDGIPTYNFAVVVDDHLMEISHVIRAEEHLSNTPKQLLLYDALGWERPLFAHVSLILGEDKSKMSKRHGSVSVIAYREEGYLPQAIVNFLALLGWSPEEEREIFSLQELERQFSLDRVCKSPAVFDVKKLRWLNSQYLRALPLPEIAAGLASFLAGDWSEERLLLLAETLANHLEVFADVKKFLPLVESGPYEITGGEELLILQQPHVKELLRRFGEQLADLTDFSPAAVKEQIKEAGKQCGCKGAALFMPLRVALTGSCHGPDIDKLTALMGRELALARLEIAEKYL